MAISVNSVLEVRPGAGSPDNGGFFVTGASGVDYSQRDTPQYALTGLSISGTTITTALAAADMVGNGFNLVTGGGATAGLYQIVSVVVGVSITVDHSAGTGTGAAANIGGAFDVMAAAMAVWIAGNVIHAKATGNNTVTSTQTLSVSGSGGSGGFTVIGYTTTRGDGGQFTWTTSTNSVHLITFTAASGYAFRNITFSSTAGTPGDGWHAGNPGNSGGISADNCIFTGCNVGVNGNFSVDWAFSNLYLADCTIASSVSHGVFNSGMTQIVNCFVHDNGGDNVRIGQGAAPTGPCLIYGSTIQNAGAIGLNNPRSDTGLGAKGQFVVINSNVTGSVGDGIFLSNGNAMGTILQNVILAFNGGWALNNSASGPPESWIIKNLFFYSNTSGNRNNLPQGQETDVLLSGDPWVSKATGNFALNNTAGAGAAVRAAGFPGTSKFGTGFIDGGPLQHQDSGGGSAGMLYIPSLEGV